MQCLVLTEKNYEINYKLNYNYNPCFNRNTEISSSHIRHILMSEAFSTVLNLKSKLFISFVHVNQQRALKTDHTGSIFVGGLGMGASMIHSHPCWTLRGNDKTIPMAMLPAGLISSPHFQPSSQKDVVSEHSGTTVAGYMSAEQWEEGQRENFVHSEDTGRGRDLVLEPFRL